MRNTVLKKTRIFTILISITILSVEFAIAEIQPVTPEAATNVKQENPAWLGVWIEKLPISLSTHLSAMLKKDQGLIIKKVSPDSPADKVPLLTYDIIIRINDNDIFTEQQLVETIRQSPSGTKVKLDIIREGKLLTQDVILEASPDRQNLSSNSPHPTLPSRHQQGMGMRPFSVPWMNDPFFKKSFGSTPFNKQFEQQFKNMHQQLDQLHQQQQQLHQNLQQFIQQQNSLSKFESIQIESTGKNQLRAIVKYDDGEGNNKEFIFSGNQEEIHKQIKANTQMDEDKKQSLLKALDMNNTAALPFRSNEKPAGD